MLIRLIHIDISIERKPPLLKLSQALHLKSIIKKVWVNIFYEKCTYEGWLTTYVLHVYHVYTSTLLIREQFFPSNEFCSYIQKPNDDLMFSFTKINKESRGRISGVSGVANPSHEWEIQDACTHQESLSKWPSSSIFLNW